MGITKRIKMTMIALSIISFINAPVQIVKAQQNSNQTITPNAIKYETRYYSKSIYNPDPNSTYYNPFPTTIIYNDGNYNGQLYIDSWYIAQNFYVVTYRGHVGPYAPLRYN